MRVSRSPDTFVIASLPAMLVGAWALGARLTSTPIDATGIWQLAWLARLGVDPAHAGVAGEWLLGVGFFVPLLATAVVVSRLWAELFARARGRPLDSGWFAAAWLYALLLPPTMPLPFVALGLSFGLLFGCHVFGGTGRYLVNPALLGIVFLGIAYPDLLSATHWLPGASAPSSWAAAAAGELDGTWTREWLGTAGGAIGAASPLACLAGAGLLIATRAASWRIVIGAAAGLAFLSAVAGPLPWYWQLALGNFALGLAFIATDPTTQATTNGGAWAYGVAFGLLTVTLRVANPDHPEGTWAALLLATLCVPLLDRIAHIRRTVGSVREDHG
jgi:Na+-transporting NADH:ubiquinone oxidoreductase subunit B